jgi:hypothetical protein
MFFGIAVLLFVAAEFVIGWWALPVVALLLGVVGAKRRFVVAMISGAAVLAWGGLYAWSALSGDLPGLMRGLAASMTLKPVQLFSAITALPALLAGPSAYLGVSLRGGAPPAEPVPAA